MYSYGGVERQHEVRREDVLCLFALAASRVLTCLSVRFAGPL